MKGAVCTTLDGYLAFPDSSLYDILGQEKENKEGFFQGRGGGEVPNTKIT